MRHDAGGASAWRGCHMLYKYTETEVKNIDNENPRNRNGNAAKPDLHCMKIHIRDRFYCRRSAKRAFLHCGEARSALLKSTLHAAKEPLSQCGKASFAASFFLSACRKRISHKQSEGYAHCLKTRVSASETLSVYSVGTLAEFSTDALHKYTVRNEYSCVT